MGRIEAADFGRRRVLWWIIDARRNFLEFVLVGVRSFSACIGFLLPLLELLSIMMVWLVGGAPKEASRCSCCS